MVKARDYEQWIAAQDASPASAPDVYIPTLIAAEQPPVPSATHSSGALTLPLDSEVRKGVPLASGCYNYFPAALAGVASHSKAGNDKHNPGEPLHHARWKSMDHPDTIARHMMDLQDMLAGIERGGAVDVAKLLYEANALCWRTLAMSQELHERYAGAPLAPAARLK